MLFALALFMRRTLRLQQDSAGRQRHCGTMAAAILARDRLAIGFLPVLGMALHNWIYGGVFVLFTATATHPAPW